MCHYFFRVLHLNYKSISVISRYSGGNTADITDDIDDNDALEDI